jgi:preprotein translocase subunit SecY
LLNKAYQLNYSRWDNNRLLAAVSNVLSVFGTGIGILLMVDILVNYYNLLVREQVDTHMPKLAALLGRT